MKWYVYRSSDTRAEMGPPCWSAFLDKQAEGYSGVDVRFYVVEGDESTPVRLSRESGCRVIVNLKGRDWYEGAEGCEVYETMPCIIIYDSYIE